MKDEICLILGNNIKKYRKLRGLTQEKLAESLEMEIKSLSLIETGNCFVSSRTLIKLSKILNISPSSLFDDLNFDDTDKLYKEAKDALEILKNNPGKLKIVNYILKNLI